MPLVPGSRLDAYELVRPLGAGGMGEVWLATEERLGRKVALKLLPVDLTSDTSRIERFEQEARAASALSHPNVCTIHALAQTGDGQHYIAMEYVEGQTLRSRVLAGSRLTVRESLDIAIQIAQALSAAHAHGIVHRDMKPENVMLRPDGFVKVLDFGLAKLVPAHQGFEAEQTRATFLTDAGTVVGTVAYMSPEQARGQDVDARSDIWALGCILYEMVAGRSPFAAPNSSDVIAAILDKDPAPIARFEPDVPAELQRIVTKALRKERAQRYQSTQDLLLDLQALRDEQLFSSSSGRAAVNLDPGRAAVPSRRPTSLGRQGLLALAVLGVAGVLAVATWWRGHGSVQPPPQAASATVPRNPKRLTVGGGLQTDATFSPDGRFFAYASNRDGNFDIWAQPVAGGDPVRISRSSADDTQPDWSPDGSTIAFHSERDGGGIYVVPALGGSERRVVAGGQHPSWSPDGKLLLFLKGVEVPGAGPPLEYSIYSFADDRETTLWPGRFVFNAAWHPDGRITAISVDPRQNQRAYDAAFLTGAVNGDAIISTALPADCSDAVRQAFPNGVSRVAWSPGGTQLFMQATAGDLESVWRLSIDPQTLAASGCERLTAGAERQSGMSLSRDGTRLAYTAQSEATRLWRVRLDGDTKREAPVPLTDEEGEVATYDVSPDGKRIALEMRHRGTDQTELQVLDIAARSTSTLGGDNVWRRSARWSPDSKRVAFHHILNLNRPTGRDTSLAVWDTTTTEHIIGRLTVPGSLMPFDWTADGRFVLVSQMSRSPAIELWSASANPPATQPVKQLIAETDSFIWQERYSPDGRWVSFVNVPTQPGSTPTIHVAPVADLGRSGWRQVAPSFAWTDKPRWSADGRRLYFLARDGGVFNVWMVSFDASRGEASGTPTQVTRFYPPELTLSPDVDKVELGVTADSLILPLKHVAGSIWMLDNVDK